MAYNLRKTINTLSVIWLSVQVFRPSLNKP